MTPLAGRAGACLQPQPGRRWPSVRATVRCGAQQNFMEDPGTQPSTSGGSEAADAEEQRRHFYSSLATLGLGVSAVCVEGALRGPGRGAWEPRAKGHDKAARQQAAGAHLAG